MKDRIKQIQEAQHMSQQVFAQFLELSPATLSNIYNGKTQPTLNVVETIKRKLPAISTEWLLWGNGQMYRSDKPRGDLFSELPDAAESSRTSYDAPGNSTEAMLNFAPAQTPSSIAPQNQISNIAERESVNQTHRNREVDNLKIVNKTQRRITEIRVSYDDMTFEVFVPEKKGK